MIILEPMGGLANRMRVIASGICLKIKLSTSLTIIWNENYELNCPFDELFEPNQMFTVVYKKKIFQYIKASNNPKLINRWFAKANNKLINIDYCIVEEDFPALIWLGKLNIYDVAVKHKNIYIKTCQEFGDASFAFQYLKPIASIADRIQNLSRNFTEHTIGVHIRRTDNQESVRHSPVFLFTNAMSAEIARHPGSMFFLCSDDIDVKEHLKALFGQKIITLSNKIDRQSISGMQNALVDLFCLSKTIKIFGSYYSSFAEVASALNNIKLEVLKADSSDVSEDY